MGLETLMVPFDTDVLVVGAGPAGLLIAGDLAARGVACAVVERSTEPSKLTRAFAVHARSLEQLDARGVADELIGTGATVEMIRVFDSLDLDLSRMPSRFPFLLCTPQGNAERVLEERATRLGAEIARGAEAVGLRQDADGVDVDVCVGGMMRTRRARFVVGADGAHSLVRDALGVSFPGRCAAQSVMLAEVLLDERPERELTLVANKEGFSFVSPYGDGWYRVIAWDRRRQLPESARVSLREVSDATRRVMGSDFGMHDARRLSRARSDERQVLRYRVGRVFLVGDAAHVHPPAGGQDMNTGLQDAANLGWKLAAAVQGWAPDGLLDTYHDERYPVGRRVVRISGTLFTAATGSIRRLRAARALVPAVANRIRPLNRWLAETISGLGISYPALPGAHRLAGQRVPDIRLVGEPRRLYEVLRAGRFVLLAPEGVPVPGGVPALEGVLAFEGLPASGRVPASAGDPAGPPYGRVVHAVPASADLPVLLIRPDGYIAWATDDGNPTSLDVGLRAALAAWCTPRPPAALAAKPV
ncbi:FAD-dependent monooxygenase [Streptosporangium sp. G11]|uniref:FAD-dependent monooxygenase n=1 Tax=Streptosporangium sp. G11 TaxID=3436926 RepID=UPI003EBB6AA8